MCWCDSQVDDSLKIREKIPESTSSSTAPKNVSSSSDVKGVRGAGPRWYCECILDRVSSEDSNK